MREFPGCPRRRLPVSSRPPRDAGRVRDRLLRSTVACVFLVSGCASVEQVTEQPITSNTESLAKVRLIALLDPDNKAQETVPGEGSLEKAFHSFYSYTPSGGGVTPEVRNEFLKRRRNSVQDRLIAASSFECGQYKARLLRVQSGANFGFSTLSSVFGTLGAIVTGVDSAQLFSGAAALTNATRAHFNESYFRQLAIEAITRAIDARRTEYVNQISERRQLDIDSYTVEYAVSDALGYHNQCNLISGLEYASDAVAASKDPPLSRTLRQLKNSGFQGEVTFDPDQARSSEQVLTAALKAVDAPVEEEAPPAEGVTGAATKTEESLSKPQGERVQRALCVAVDGDFGVSTRAAIATFQELNALGGDNVEPGFLDPLTHAKIVALGRCPSGYRSYFERHTFPDEAAIKKVQKALGVTETGNWDTATRDGIKALQRTNNLAETGIIDKALMKKIFPAVG